MDKGYRVIMPNQVGFGKSTKPAYYQYSFVQLALNTPSLLSSLKIDHYKAVGHSMGAC
jgi:pimeloyl-ACP methyl ester carboxylesterase